ncbi:uncharacterized protein LOC106763317 [Vigna radiata var. radiata]|uniref:Uncharacterized protein LOC106763317 n=1 Tax=Vigna radiata var. radiata TaxID=3916 RepID=A0A1S3UAK9_VIGRR|nr:uncharacterized protein LOC106763317 [Vigna radiata var. radiata]
MSTASLGVHCIQDTLKEDMELEQQLNLINKPSIKVIQTKYGDIIDCIDINKQLAFNHPLLKNHRLQRKPSFPNPIRKTSMKNLRDKHIFGLDKDQCPKGTIPVRRTTKEDLIREKGLLNNSIFVEDIPGVHLAEVALSSKFSPYYGVKGTNSIYNPKVTKSQMSLSHIWVQNGPFNKISLGWHRDNYDQTGCYNLKCPGFVQTHGAIFVGAPFTNVSSYGGPLVDFLISINQDPLTKNWWLRVKDSYIGYFPIKLFSGLDFADKVGWGGRTLTPRGSNSPPMGSGHFPDMHFHHASYFRLISYKNASKDNYGPEDYQIEKFIDKPNCFGLSYYGNLHKNLEYSFQFGGPGGNCGD